MTSRPRPELSMRPYQMGDADLVEPMADHVEEFEIAHPSWLCERERPPGMAWTVLLGARPIACAGLQERKPREFDVWAWLSVMTRREWAYATERTRLVLRFAEADLGATLFRAWARIDRPAAQRQLEKLGFEVVADRFDGPIPLREMVRKARSWIR